MLPVRLPSHSARQIGAFLGAACLSANPEPVCLNAAYALALTFCTADGAFLGPVWDSGMR